MIRFFISVIIIYSQLRTAIAVGKTARAGSNIYDSSAPFFSRILHKAKIHKGSPLPARVDLVLILDSSSAVGDKRNFKSLQSFANRLVSEFSISPSTTRVGLVLCSAKPYLQFGLNKFVNRECTLKALRNGSLSHGQHCRLDKSLQLAYKIILQSRRRSSFNDKPRPMVVIFNTSPLDKFSLSAAIAKRLRGFGVEVFLLTIGHPVSYVKLKTLVDRPLECHYLNVKSATQLDAKVVFIKNKGLDHRSCEKGGIVYDECTRRCECSNGRMVNCYRVRKDFPSMSLEERRLYIHVLKTVSIVQPYKQIYDEMTSYHPKWFDDVHELQYFFPWHRWYILEFENFLRQIDCRVTVPYWDWTRAVSSGTLWRAAHIHDVWHPAPHGLGGNGKGPERCVPNGPFGKGNWSPPSKLNVTCLTREFNNCYGKGLPSKDDRKELLGRSLKEFEDFETDVREWMHNDFHNAIGGTMSLDASANAPEFWFHHGFLDKMWADWQKRGYKYKHQYYHNVRLSLPGTKVKGATFIDLSRQPSCIRVRYDDPSDNDFTDNKVNPNITEPAPVWYCGDDDDGDDDDTDDDDDNSSDKKHQIINSST